MIDGLRNRLKRVPLLDAANSVVRGHLQEREVDGLRRAYALRARQSGIEAPGREDMQRRLKDRIAARARALGWPRRAGELHLFLAYSEENWESVLPSALAPFGAVSRYEWRSRGYHEGRPGWLVQRDQMNAELFAAFKAANRERPVDVVVGCLSGHTVSPEILKLMADAGAVITNFCFDDKLHWPGPVVDGRHVSTAGIASRVDLSLTNDPDAATRYLLHGGLSLFHPEAADPTFHRPSPLPLLHDVTFIGARYGWRPRFIERLRGLGVDVECFGRGWPNGPVANERIPELFSCSRINLGFGGVGHSRRLMCLKGRDFEVPMSGGLYLAQHNPELRLVFDIGTEIVTFRDEEHCAALIRELLADEPRAARVREAGRARCLRDHTYEVRWRRVLEFIGALV